MLLVHLPQLLLNVNQPFAAQRSSLKSAQRHQLPQMACSRRSISAYLGRLSCTSMHRQDLKTHRDPAQISQLGLVLQQAAMLSIWRMCQNSQATSHQRVRCLIAEVYMIPGKSPSPAKLSLLFASTADCNSFRVTVGAHMLQGARCQQTCTDIELPMLREPKRRLSSSARAVSHDILIADGTVRPPKFTKLVQQLV